MSKKEDYYEFVERVESDAEQVAGLTCADGYYCKTLAYTVEQGEMDPTEMDQDEYDPWEEID